MTKREKIKLLLQSTNMSKGPESGFKDLVQSLPDDKIPRLSKVKRKFVKRFEEITTETLAKQIDLYDTLLSEDAIDASIHFYSTIEGQEIISKLPKINRGLMELTQQFTGTLAKEFLTELLELEPTEEEMGIIGFSKISIDLDELEEKEENDRIVPKDSPDANDEFEQFMKDYGIGN